MSARTATEQGVSRKGCAAEGCDSKMRADGPCEGARRADQGAAEVWLVGRVRRRVGRSSTQLRRELEEQRFRKNTKSSQSAVSERAENSSLAQQNHAALPVESFASAPRGSAHPFCARTNPHLQKHTPTPEIALQAQLLFPDQAPPPSHRRLVTRS
jgi:hypothetical protein